MDHKSIYTNYFINSVGKVNNNYAKIFSKRLTIDEQNIITSCYPEYSELIDKLLSIRNGGINTCSECNNIMSWRVKTKTCSRACANEAIKVGYKATMNERYGVDNSSQLETTTAKRKQTNLERYGVEHAAQSVTIKKKMADTNIERYGGHGPQCSSEVKSKTIETNLEKYGVHNAALNEDVVAKRKHTNMERYGVENATSSTVIQDKIKQTNLDRYGFISTLSVQSTTDKKINTLNERYGVDHYSKTDEFKHNRLDKIIKFVRDGYSIELTFEEASQLSIKLTKKYSSEYINALVEFIRNGTKPCENLIRRENHMRIPRNVGDLIEYEYGSQITTSSYEDIICSWLEEFGVDYIRSDRSVLAPKELDIYIPSHNLAIEFNGTYWHSDMFKPKNYHQDKTNQCNDLGITLIHVYEYTFVTKHQVYKNLLKAKLGLNTRVYARKCVLKEVESNEERDFLNQHHLQGYVASTNCYGLYYNDELVTVCSFGKTRFGKSDDIELLRNCSKPDTTVVGGLSKLIKHYKSTHDVESIICYSDASISFNKGGDITQPNYKWVKNDLILSRYQTMKHKLHKVLGDKFDPTLTEVENMTVNRFYRIFDAGNYVSNI